MRQQYQQQQPSQSTSYNHPQMTSTERPVESVIIPKRMEEDITNKPPEGKKKKRRVTFSEKPQIDRETMPYSIVQDLMHVKSNVTIAQLLTIPQYRKELKKALTPKRSRPGKKKGDKGKQGILIGASLTHTPMICKGQVSMWTIEIIIDSGSSVSIISKSFADSIKRIPNKKSVRLITGIHGNKSGSLGIITDIPVHLGDVVMSVDMEVIDTQAYTMVLGNDWLQKAKATINYNPPSLTITDGIRTANIQCQNSASQENWEEEEDEDDDDDEDEESSDEEDDNDNVNIGLNYTCRQN
jgi:hypothetical protein